MAGNVELFDNESLERLHGHVCVGLAIGVRAARAGMRASGRDAASSTLTVVGETHTCPVDAVQVLTGCTVGNGRLLLQDHGKTTFTFFATDEGRGVRVAARPWGSPDSDYRTLFDAIMDGSAGLEERRRFAELQLDLSRRVMAASDDELFVVSDVEGSPPPRAIGPSVACGQCGEATMEWYLADHAGRSLCLPCRSSS